MIRFYSLSIDSKFRGINFEFKVANHLVLFSNICLLFLLKLFIHFHDIIIKLRLIIKNNLFIVVRILPLCKRTNIQIMRVNSIWRLSESILDDKFSLPILRRPKEISVQLRCSFEFIFI